jgi:hypothetical protein
MKPIEAKKSGSDVRKVLGVRKAVDPVFRRGR